MQEQDQDCTDPHPLRRQASIPRASVNEHCGANVYKPIRSLDQVKGIFATKRRRSWEDTTNEFTRKAGEERHPSRCAQPRVTGYS